MLADDVILNNPLNESFPIIVFVICLAVTLASLFMFNQYPYKLNRSDYDYGRRSTMVSSYSLNSSGGKGPSNFKKRPAGAASEEISDEDNMS